MSKRMTGLLLAVMLLLSLSAGVLAAEEKEQLPLVGCKEIIDAREWGPSVVGVLAEFEGELTAEDAANLTVATRVSGMKTNREILEAVLCDSAGAPVNGPSRFVCFKLTAAYNVSAPMSQVGGVTGWAKDYKAVIAVAKEQAVTIGGKAYAAGTSVSYTFTEEDRLFPFADRWNMDTYTQGIITLNTAAYEPEGIKDDSGKNALIVWLHGGGGGGTDINVALTDSEVPALMEDDESGIQSFFMTDGLKGAYVLALQCPTMWMQRDAGGIDSYYLEVCLGAIRDYIDSNPDVDPERVFVGGCSNGGYMTVDLMLHAPELFKAYFPTCEPFPDTDLTEENIALMAGLNIWFVQAADDTLVTPETFCLPTYRRLLEAGAENVHLTMLPHVSGNECDATYHGHWSWINLLNNEVTRRLDDEKALAALQADPNAIAMDDTNSVEENIWAWMAGLK